MSDIELDIQRQEFRKRMHQLGSFKNRFWSSIWRTTGYVAGTSIVAIILFMLYLLLR